MRQTMLKVMLTWGGSVLVCLASLAQSGSSVQTPLYLDLGNANKKIVHDITNGVLSLEYNDVYGRKDALALKIYNWKRTIVANVSLSKTRGINRYSFNLETLLQNPEKNYVYYCEAVDENGGQHVLPIRLVDPPEAVAITASVFVAPTVLSCDVSESSLVEFYGSVTGGKAPYTVNWYVLNTTRTDFLYQPREQKINQAGTTASVQLDANPDYYVLMDVTDACGAQQQQVVQVVCERGKKKINTVFFETMLEMKKPAKAIR